MKPGGVSTCGLLIVRDAQTMTTDVQAQVGWSPPRPVGTGLGQRPASCRRMRPAVAQEPAGPWSPARASSLHAIPAAAGAVYRVEGQAHAAVPRLVKDRRRSART